VQDVVGRESSRSALIRGRPPKRLDGSESLRDPAGTEQKYHKEAAWLLSQIVGFPRMSSG
jgi:hypothetical protein